MVGYMDRVDTRCCSSQRRKRVPMIGGYIQKMEIGVFGYGDCILSPKE